MKVCKAFPLHINSYKVTAHHSANITQHVHEVASTALSYPISYHKLPHI